MKKTIIKTSLFIVCVALALFLLLPFFDTGSSTAQGQRAKPQIFTSNPLTSLVNRLASLFKGKENKQKLALQSNEQPNVLQDSPLAAAQAPGMQEEWIASSNGEDPESSSTEMSAYASDEDWVLVPQSSPELKAQGMHEINASEDPYERYVQQQEHDKHLSALTSAPLNTQMPSEKESGWHKFISPIKRFFGLEDPQSVEAGQFINNGSSSEDAFQLASVKNGPNYHNTGSTNTPYLPDGNMNFPTFQLGADGENDTLQETQRLFSLLSYDDTFEHIAEAWGASKSDDPKQAKAAAKQKHQQMRTELKEFIRSNMQEAKENSEPQNNIEVILHGCSISSLPQRKDVCTKDDMEPKQPASEKEIQREQELNAQRFYETTKIKLPRVPITPILGKATRPQANDSFMGQEGFDEQDMQGGNLSSKSLQIATWLYDKNKCDNSGCFWVANSRQVSPELSDSVKKTGAKFVGDPLNWYDDMRELYVQEKLRNIPPEQRAQARQKIEQDFNQAAPAFIPYDTQQIRETYQSLQKTAKRENMDKNAAFFYVTDQHDVLDVAEAAGGYQILYSQEELRESSTPEGRQITSDSARCITTIAQKAVEIGNITSQEAIRNRLNKGIDQFNKMTEKNGGDTAAAYNTMSGKRRKK